MKRSELVTRIEEYLLHTQHLDIPCSLGSDFKAAAEELVVLIENVGMLPPPDYTETYYSGDEPGGYHPNFWENEDE